MTLYAGQTFNEELMLLPGTERSQYTIRVTSDEANVFVLNALEFRKLKQHHETIKFLVLLMQNKAEVLFQQMESRPIWRLVRAESYSKFFKECFMYNYRPDPKHDPMTGPSPFELSLDRKV